MYCTGNKDKSFKTTSLVDCVSHLITDLGLSKEATDLLLTDGEVIKLANYGMPMSMPATEQYPETSVEPGQTSIPQNQPYVMPAMSVDQAPIEAAAELGDPDLLDTGLLASVAGNEDIKGVLVDMLPTFQDTVSELGKSILLFNTHREDLEEQYGRDQYSSVLANLRKIFTSLGKVVYDLKTYINMAGDY